MKVLFICSGNTSNTFVAEQADSLKKKGIDIVFFYIKGKGIKGYLKSIKPMWEAFKTHNPDLIHAHYGLAGFLANLQFKLPVVTTYHGCDINKFTLRLLSLFSLFKSNANIFVSNEQYNKVRWFIRSNFYVIPCGVNLEDFKINNNNNVYSIPNLEGDYSYILFCSDFETPVKNYPLALKSIGLVNEKIKLIELKGYNRIQVNELLNSCEVLLMTSIREGSPQLVKEAMACNCPIVSTDVGDVKYVIGNTDGCYITSFSAYDIAEKIKMALNFSRTSGRTDGRKRITELGLNSESISNKIVSVYDNVLSKTNKK